MGGAKEYSNTPNKLKAKSLVMQLWNLFGVGTGIDPAFRPFGKVIVHGFDISKSVFLRINSSNPNQHTLDNEDHSTKNYNIFVSLLRQTMSTDTSKKKLHVRRTSVSHPGQINPTQKYASLGFRFCAMV